MTIWLVIIGLAVTTAAIKAAGPVLFGGREPGPAFLGVVALLAPALLTALVATALFSDGRSWSVGLEVVGVAVGAVLLWRGWSVLLAVAVAVGLTAVLRALL